MALMDLNAVWVFTKVVQTGSFSAAARQLGMPKSTVSMRVSQLEARLGVTLLKRTTRKLSLTQPGAAYFETCQRSLEELAAAESGATRAQQQPRGLLRVT